MDCHLLITFKSIILHRQHLIKLMKNLEKKVIL